MCSIAPRSEPAGPVDAARRTSAAGPPPCVQAAAGPATAAVAPAHPSDASS